MPDTPIIHDIDHASGDHTFLSFEIETEAGERIPMRCRINEIHMIIHFFLACADHAARSLYGGPPQGRPDIGQATPLPNARIWINGVEGDHVAAATLDFGIARFAVLLSAVELRQIASDAMTLVNRIEQKKPS